jgi:hypothetical protein
MGFFSYWAAKSFDDLSLRIEWWLRYLPLKLVFVSSLPVGLDWGSNASLTSNDLTLMVLFSVTTIPILQAKPIERENTREDEL